MLMIFNTLQFARKYNINIIQLNNLISIYIIVFVNAA